MIKSGYDTEAEDHVGTGPEELLTRLTGQERIRKNTFNRLYIPGCRNNRSSRGHIIHFSLGLEIVDRINLELVCLIRPPLSLSRRIELWLDADIWEAVVAEIAIVTSLHCQRVVKYAVCAVHLCFEL